MRKAPASVRKSRKAPNAATTSAVAASHRRATHAAVATTSTPWAAAAVKARHMTAAAVATKPVAAAAAASSEEFVESQVAPLPITKVTPSTSSDVPEEDLETCLAAISSVPSTTPPIVVPSTSTIKSTETTATPVVTVAADVVAPTAVVAPVATPVATPSMFSQLMAFVSSSSSSAASSSSSSTTTPPPAVVVTSVVQESKYDTPAAPASAPAAIVATTTPVIPAGAANRLNAAMIEAQIRAMRGKQRTSEFMKLMPSSSSAAAAAKEEKPISKNEDAGKYDVTEEFVQGVMDRLASEDLQTFYNIHKLRVLVLAISNTFTRITFENVGDVFKAILELLYDIDSLKGSRMPKKVIALVVIKSLVAQVYNNKPPQDLESYLNVHPAKSFEALVSRDDQLTGNHRPSMTWVEAKKKFGK